MIFSLTGFSRASGAFVLAAITLAATLPLACMKADDSRPPTTTASTPAVEKLRQAIRNGTPEEKEKALERFADEKIVELVPDVIEAIADPTKLPEHGDTGWGFVGHEAGTLMVRISADYDGVPYQQSGYTNWSFHNDSAGGKELQESGRLDEVRANWRTWWAAQKLRAPGAPAATIAAPLDVTPPALADLLRYLTENGLTVERDGGPVGRDGEPNYNYFISNVAPDAPFPTLQILLRRPDETAAHFARRITPRYSLHPSPDMAAVVDGHSRPNRDVTFKEESYVQARARLEQLMAAYVPFTSTATSGAGAPTGGPASAPATSPATTQANLIQTADDLEASVSPETTDFEIGQPVLVTVTLHNTGKSTYSFSYYEDFGTGCLVVRDAKQNILRRFQDGVMSVRFGSYMGGDQHIPPGASVPIKLMLNNSTLITTSGDYTVEPRVGVHRDGDPPAAKNPFYLCKSTPVTVHVRDFDGARRAADIDALVAAYHAGTSLPKDRAISKDHGYNDTKYDNIRLLSYFNDLRAIPVLLEEFQAGDTNAYASNGLHAMTDRPAVLKALTALLDDPAHCKKFGQLLYIYTELSVAPDYHNVTDWIARNNAARKPYVDKAFALIKADTAHQYVSLASELCSITGDTFLISYMLHSPEALTILPRHTTWLTVADLPASDEPLIVGLLESPDRSLRDCALQMLLRRNEAKYMPLLRNDKPDGTGKFSKYLHDAPSPAIAIDHPTTTAPAPQPAEVADSYRTLYTAYQKLILAAAQAGDADKVANLTEEFHQDAGKKLLYLRVQRLTPGEKDKWQLLFDKHFASKKLGLPAIDYPGDGRPYVYFDANFVLVLPVKLGGGRYPDDLYITMVLEPPPASGASAPTGSPASAPSTTTAPTTAPATAAWTPPYTDDEARAFAAKISSLTFPTTIEDACEALGIDFNRLTHNAIMKVSGSGTTGSSFGHLSPSYMIAFQCHLLTDARGNLTSSGIDHVTITKFGRAAALDELESQLRKSLPKDWTLTRRDGDLTPPQRDDPGQGTLFVIDQPPASATGKASGLELFVMAPDYHGRVHVYGPKPEDLPQALAPRVTTWRGGLTFETGGFERDYDKWKPIHEAVARVLIETDPAASRNVALIPQVNKRLAKLADDLAFLNDDAREFLKDNAADSLPVPKLGFAADHNFRDAPSFESGGSISLDFNLSPETKIRPAVPLNPNRPALRLYVSAWLDLSDGQSQLAAVDADPVAAKNAKGDANTIKWDGKSENQFLIVANRWHLSVTLRGNRPDHIKQAHALIDAALNDFIVLLDPQPATTRAAATVPAP